MLIKAGVDISRLKRVMRRTLPVVARIVDAIEREELVVTSTYEGNHGEGSLHYCDEAYDIRKHKKPDIVCREIKRELGPDFDVIVFSKGIHLEYDPDIEKPLLS